MDLFAGQRLRKLRKEHGWNREDFAEHVGSTPRMITFYETNKRKPSLEKAVMIAETLGVSLDYLCNRSYIKEVNSTSPNRVPKVFDNFYTEADIMTIEEYLTNIKSMIDELKAMAADLGLSNTGDEYKIISELFTYKFLNDKVILQFEQSNEKSYEDFLFYRQGSDAGIPENCLIRSLYQKQQDEEFHNILARAFEEINEENNRIFAVETVTGQKRRLFDPFSDYIRDEKKEKELAVRAINILHDYDFTGIVNKGFDYFSNIFEYLIRDYNKDSGKYAEYFTPASVADIIADVLYDDQEVNGVTVYDPAAGSGTLLLSMANKIGTDRCTIFSQDISQKSTQFLRINLILNNLVHSLRNAVEGDTLLNPAHMDSRKESELRKFNFIVSNPPFNTDFSSSVEKLKEDTHHRFFAGLPNVPKKKKNSMAIYQTFFQHILSSMSKDGKAAVVVPTGFVSSDKGIALSIKQSLVDENWLMGVVHMPSQIFANTGTSVSIVFVDKRKEDEKVMLLDASSFGESKKMPEGQRTVLNEGERMQIIQKFKSRESEAEFSAWVANSDIQENDYSLSAGQYVEIKPEELDFDIDKRLGELEKQITNSLTETEHDMKKIISFLKGGGIIEDKRCLHN